MKANVNAILIDHDDSFTFNLRHWLQGVVNDVTIINHRALLESSTRPQLLENQLIVLSPGPNSPNNYPHTIKWMNEMDAHNPVLGICLGMQLMTLAGGGGVSKYAPPLHGKTSKLKTDLPFGDLSVARYHSLGCSGLDQFKILATSDDLPMWIQHKKKKWMGMQFHPESFLTEKSNLLQNFCLDWLNETSH